MFSQFEHVVRHWRGTDGNPSGAQHHGCGLVAAIEAILEFGKIAGRCLSRTARWVLVMAFLMLLRAVFTL